MSIASPPLTPATSVSSSAAARQPLVTKHSMDGVNPLTALFPPMTQATLGSVLVSDNTMSGTASSNASKEVIDWSALFSATGNSATNSSSTTMFPPGIAGLAPTAPFAGSPEVNSVGSPASSRDFEESPLFDFELPFSTENQTPLFPPEQPGEVAEWLSNFNLMANGSLISSVEQKQAFDPAATNGASAAQLGVAQFLRTAAQFTAQQHSQSSQASSTSGITTTDGSTLTFSQKQDRGLANVLANSTADLACSQQSIVSSVSSEDDYTPIRAPASLASTNAAPSLSDLQQPVAQNPWAALMPRFDYALSSSQQSMASSVSTLSDSQRPSTRASPTITGSPSNAATVHTLATVFVREYARMHPVHDIDTLVRGLRLAGIDIPDEVLRDIVGPSPLSLGSPASQVGSISSPPVAASTSTGYSMSATNSNANFAMLMSGLGVASSNQSDYDIHSQPALSQSTTVSSLSSVPDAALPGAEHFTQQSSQLSAATQYQSDDDWSSDASWSPYTQAMPPKTKVTQSTPTTARARSSVQTQHTSAKADILKPTASTSSVTAGPTSEDGVMTTVYLSDGKRAFSCNVCHKLFERAFNLRTHYDTHKSAEEREKGKRFICPHDAGKSDACGKPFARKHDCIRHWRTVHGKAVAGTSSNAALSKLKVPQPIVKHRTHSSASEDDEFDDEDDSDHHSDVGDSTNGSSFG